MPSGIIIKSASHEESDAVRDANVKAVIESAGYEVPEPEPPAEPKREDFKTDEEFEAAHVDWQDKEEKKAEEAEDEAHTPPKGRSFKARRTRAIERATAEKDRRIKELEAQLAAKGEAAPAKEEPPKEKQRPKRADFNGDDEAYEDALLKWGNEKALKDKALQDAEAANKARFEQNVQNYATQVEEAKEKYDDWDDVVNQEIFIGQEVQLAILEQDNGAEVIYYLGRHPAYATKLGEIYKEKGPLSAIREAERLSVRLLADKSSASDETDREEKPKPRPKVPAPVRTVNTGGPSGALTFAEIAAKPNYPGKARDLRAASARE